MRLHLFRQFKVPNKH